jgi:26S proteasome regulatory subunit N10
MVLEAVMICVDNSEYARNGDYVPQRLGAQTEAAGELANRKLDGNMESLVGIMSLGCVCVCECV